MTILRTHHMDGTVGATITTASESFDTAGGAGTAPVYASGGFSNQCGEWTYSSAGDYYFQDNTTAAYAAVYLMMPALPTSDMSFLTPISSTGSNMSALVVTPAGKITMYSGLSTLVATSTTTISPNTWYRLEWNVTNTGTQTLNIYSPATSGTITETLTGAAATATQSKWRYGLAWAGKVGATGNTLCLDELNLADAWPNLGETTPVANAGPDQAGIAAGATVTLDGSGSTYSSPDTAVAYAWTQTAGTAVTLSSTTAQKPTFTAPSTASAQTLTFSLTVTGNTSGLASSADTVNIGVLAAAPTSNLKLLIGGVWTSVVEKILAGGVWTAVSDTIMTAVGDQSLYSDTYADAY